MIIFWIFCFCFFSFSHLLVLVFVDIHNSLEIPTSTPYLYSYESIQQPRYIHFSDLKLVALSGDAFHEEPFGIVPPVQPRWRHRVCSPISNWVHDDLHNHIRLPEDFSVNAPKWPTCSSDLRFSTSGPENVIVSGQSELTGHEAVEFSALFVLGSIL